MLLHDQVSFSSFTLAGPSATVSTSSVSNENTSFVSIEKTIPALWTVLPHQTHPAANLLSDDFHWYPVTIVEKDTSSENWIPSFLVQNISTGSMQPPTRFRLIIEKSMLSGTFSHRNKSTCENYKKIPIMGKGHLRLKDMQDFMLDHNPGLDKKKVAKLIKTYQTECYKEGINHDLAFIQMCHETGFLKFTGVVKENQNNFCGLGSVNEQTPGLSFSSMQEGIRAHVQHLKAYASKDDLILPLVDTRFYYVERGSAKILGDLTGKWAQDPLYDKKIAGLLQRLKGFSTTIALSGE
jgi:hypothetical protein